MAWNGSNRENAKARGEGERRKGKFRSSTSASNINYKALAAGLVVVLGGGIAVYFMLGRTSPSGEGDVSVGARPARIAEARPQVVTNRQIVAEAEPEKPREKTEEEVRAEKIAYFERVFGADMPPAIKAVVYYLKHPPKQNFKVNVPFDYLRHPSEQQVASLMAVEPGTYFVINPNYGQDFDDDFATASQNGTEVGKDDGDEIRVVKENVAAVMKDLARICREEGKRPSQVMAEYADSLYSLGQFQRDIEEDLQKIYEAPEYSDEDVKDFCEAANKMLEEKGIAPMPYPDLTERCIELQYNKHALERNEGQ